MPATDAMAAIRDVLARAEQTTSDADLTALLTGLADVEVPETYRGVVVRADGLVKVCAGITFALGRAPRLSSLVLIASLVPTTLAGHRFWEESDADARAAQQLHLLKNAAIAGGLLLAAVDTEGRPSLGWRAKQALPVG